MKRFLLLVGMYDYAGTEEDRCFDPMMFFTSPAVCSYEVYQDSCVTSIGRHSQRSNTRPSLVRCPLRSESIQASRQNA